MASTNPPASVIDTTVGPLVTGVMIQQLFLGVICSEVVDYYRTFGKDSLFNKGLVAFLLLLNVLLGVMDYHVLYRTSVIYYGQYDHFDLESWTMWAEPGLTAIVGFVAQAFFLRRCWMVTHSWIILVLLSLLVLLSVGSGLAVSIKFFEVEMFSKLALIPIPISFWLISTSVADIAIATVLTVALVRSKTPFKKTEAVISRIVRLSMETSAATALVALLNLIFYFTMMQTAYHLLPQFSMSRVYTMTVLITLSSRKTMQSVFQGTGQSSIVTAMKDSKRTRSDNVNIQVTTTKYVDGDTDSGTPWDGGKRHSDIELGTKTGASYMDPL